MAAIELNTPEITPATPEKVYNLLWLSQLNIMADNPNQKVAVSARLDKGRILEDGVTWELKKDGSSYVNIDDFFAEAEANPALLQIMGGILTELKTRAAL